MFAFWKMKPNTARFSTQKVKYKVGKKLWYRVHIYTRNKQASVVLVKTHAEVNIFEYA